jgi:hypothetical protein
MPRDHVRKTVPIKEHETAMSAVAAERDAALRKLSVVKLHLAALITSLAQAVAQKAPRTKIVVSGSPSKRSRAKVQISPKNVRCWYLELCGTVTRFYDKRSFTDAQRLALRQYTCNVWFDEDKLRGSENELTLAGGARTRRRLLLDGTLQQCFDGVGLEREEQAAQARKWLASIPRVVAPMSERR